MRDAPSLKAVCDACAATSTKICQKCSREFCPHHASLPYDDYCASCPPDIQVEVYTRRDVKITKINGPDFYFAQETIHRLSDKQLDDKIEFFEAMLSGMRLERAERQVERQARQAKVKLVARPAAAPAAPTAKKAKPTDMTVVLTQLLGHVPSQQELAAFMKLTSK